MGKIRLPLRYDRFSKIREEDFYYSVLEGVLARGDRKVADVILKAYEKGCMYASWSESFMNCKWLEAFEECGVDIAFYTTRPRNLEEVCALKLRIKFHKFGAVKFIGHLDVMRFFQKALKRADIDVAYSGGFSPHQIMSFASPLVVGLESNGEYFDVEINSPISSQEFIDKVNAVSILRTGFAGKCIVDYT